MIIFFALLLLLWRFVFDLQCRPAVTKIDEDRRRDVFEEGLPYPGLDWTGTAVLARRRFDGGSDTPDFVDPKDRARTYLCRIVALTGATQRRNIYVLNVGKTRFSVRDGYVRRLQDSTDPKCRYEETCFYSANKEVPRLEQIASVLLQLRNNPALFDAWATQRGLAFKADGVPSSVTVLR